MIFPRYITSEIVSALSDTPVLMLTGARQTGKTTLVKQIASEIHPAKYFTMDDLTIRGAVLSDAMGFLRNISGNIIIDEIQLAPDLLSAIKLEVDQNRQPGRFIITGSANVLTLPRVAESLAGRIAIYSLLPLSQGELISQKEDFIDWLFADTLEFIVPKKSDANMLWDKTITGGYPEIVLRTITARREAWFKDYVSTIIQRDIRDLANIEGLTQIPRLLELLATRMATLVNFSELSRSIQIPQTSLKRYISLLEMTYLIQFVPAWSNHPGKRLLKMPKLFFVDTGLSAYLLGINSDTLKKPTRDSGPILENFIVSELYKQTSWSNVKSRIYHFRNQTDQEVDFILENRQRQCVGIEVKASATVRSDDFKSLRWFQQLIGEKFLRGIVLYTGPEFVPFGNDLFAVPVEYLWNIHQKN